MPGVILNFGQNGVIKMYFLAIFEQKSYSFQVKLLDE